MPSRILVTQHELLLVFKDFLPTSTGKGFPLVSESETIRQHRAMFDVKTRNQFLGEQPEEADEGIGSRSQLLLYRELPQTDLFDQKEADILPAETLWPDAFPDDCCVWGWWRKAWETHPDLLRQLKMRCAGKVKPKVLLYNQYVTRIYRAELHDLFFLPFMTTVALPEAWYEHCPRYYRNEPRLSGAFLALRIPERHVNDARALLKNRYIDSASFEFKPCGIRTVIPAPDTTPALSYAMIDKPVRRADMRASDCTILLTRNFRQRERTARILANQRSSPGIIMEAFKETEWHDIVHVLSECDLIGWKHLSRVKDAIDIIGKKARSHESRIARLDIELFAYLVADEETRCLVKEDGAGQERFNDLGRALRSWVTSRNSSAARKAAAIVFQKAWGIAQNLYRLSDEPKHFAHLPSLEAVSSAVRYGLGGKFYRDHLSHNIRAALLTPRLVSKLAPLETEGVSESRIAFFAGLFHDLGIPLTSFPDTVQHLASAVSLSGAAATQNPVSSLVEPGFYKTTLHYVALLSTLPNIANLQSPFRPWENPDAVNALAEQGLIQELLLCARLDEHAIIGAALLFQSAVKRRGAEGNLDAAVRTFMGESTGPDANVIDKELLSLLQCIALHDRKAVVKYHPVQSFPKSVPCVIDLARYRMPIIVAMADELQEWGRPLGELESISVSDAQIEFDGKVVETTFAFSPSAETYENVPFCLLHALIEKVRMLTHFTSSADETAEPIELNCRFENLAAFRMCRVFDHDFRLAYKGQTLRLKLDAWPLEESSLDNRSGAEGERLFGIAIGERGDVMRDLLIVKGDDCARERLQEMSASEVPFRALVLRRGKIELEFQDGTRMVGRALEYMFGELKSGDSVPSNRFPEEGPCSVLTIELLPLAAAPAVTLVDDAILPQRRPHAHFLDFDWRFGDNSARWIVEAARAYVGEGSICYLGCPSLALWHQLQSPDDASWQLLDRGHFALKKWIAEERVPTERHIAYDVFEALPENLAHRFDVVVTDPPWYAEEYRAFVRRAAELTKRNGLIFMSSYPPFKPYKPEKFEQLRRIVETELAGSRWLGSFEIEYDVPEFEKSWKGHEQFQHLALGVYRPAYMDIFRASGARSTQVLRRSRGRHSLDGCMELTESHLVMYDSRLVFPLNVKIGRHKSVKHFGHLEEGIVAWTTRNAVVRRVNSGGETVESLEELRKLIEGWEASR